MPTRPTALLALALLASGCGPSEPAVAGPQAAGDGFVAEHDFGTIPHGEERTADIRLPMPTTGGPWIPVGFRRSCSCAQHRFVVVAADGSERLVDGIGAVDPADAVPADGSLRIRLTIRTAEKEAADLAPVWTPGHVVLQEVGSAVRREFVPIRFRFGIDAPLTLTPFAHFDLGDIPRPIRFAQALEIRADAGVVHLGAPQCLETLGGRDVQIAPDVTVGLTANDDGGWTLEAAIQPGDQRPDGPFSMAIVIPTDLDGGYDLRVPISGAVVPGVQVAPPGKILFGAFPFDQERESAVMVTDHDPTRPATYHVVGIVDSRGSDLSDHFSSWIEPVQQRARSCTVQLRYDGRLDTRSFRGEVLLAKEPGGAPVLRVEFAGFDRR